METRGQIKQRLKAKGQWQEFVQLRALFKAEGLEPREARQAALVELEVLFGQDESYYQSCSSGAARSAVSSGAAGRLPAPGGGPR